MLLTGWPSSFMCYYSNPWPGSFTCDYSKAWCNKYKIRVGIGSSPREGASPGLKTCKLSAVSRVGYWAVPTPLFTTFYCIFPHPSMRSTLVTCIARYGCLGCRTEFSFVVIAPVVSLSLIQDFQFILSPLAALYNKKWSRVGHFCSDSEQA